MLPDAYQWLQLLEDRVELPACLTGVGEEDLQNPWQAWLP